MLSTALQLIGILAVAVGLGVALFGGRQEINILIGLSGAISGLLFLAFGKVLDLLQDIADSLRKDLKDKAAD